MIVKQVGAFRSRSGYRRPCFAATVRYERSTALFRDSLSRATAVIVFLFFNTNFLRDLSRDNYLKFNWCPFRR